MADKLRLEDVHASSNGKELLKGVGIEVRRGEVCVIMGPNGAGKSTVANVIMGNPKYEVTKGMIYLDEEKINDLSPEERARKGIFMSFQHPVEIDGVTFANFLRSSYNFTTGKNLNIAQFQKLLNEKMEELEIDSRFRSRFVNTGFSGGEKKRSEILQLLLLEPEFAILDEVDSGLDVDALKLLSSSIRKLKEEKNMGLIVITHYNKILDHIRPDRVYLLKDGRVEKTGSAELVKEIEKKGFAS